MFSISTSRRLGRMALANKNEAARLKMEVLSVIKEITTPDSQVVVIPAGRDSVSFDATGKHVFEVDSPESFNEGVERANWGTPASVTTIMGDPCKSSWAWSLVGSAFKTGTGRTTWIIPDLSHVPDWDAKMRILRAPPVYSAQGGTIIVNPGERFPFIRPNHLLLAFGYKKIRQLECGVLIAEY